MFKSNLALYVSHREEILKVYGKTLQSLSEAGKELTATEDDIHDLIFKRATSTSDYEGSYWKHNLWLIDDKYSYFSLAKSTQKGQKLSDIYTYLDSQDSPDEVVIIKLKRPSKAHNAGEMIKQVKDYAKDFYNKGKNILGKDIDSKKCLYHVFILASREDIIKEKKESGTCFPIPYLSNSFITDHKFYPDTSDTEINIRIELISFSDIERLAKKRNKNMKQYLSLY